MDSGATKQMTLHRTTFNTYEVVFQRNMHLGDDGVAKAIDILSIVIEVEKRGIKNRVCSTYVLHVPKLQVNLFLVSKLLSNKLNVSFYANAL